MRTPPAILGGIVVALTMSMWQAAAGADRDVPTNPARLNVLMIVVDDLRDDIGCFGNRLAKTPNIDRLAARGVVFNRAYCQQAVCSPSRTSFLTGQRPDVTRVWDLKTHFRKTLPECVTLPQCFKEAGYHCAALGKVYHRGYEDGRSWSEPHWYPNGKTVDVDPADWTNQTTRKHGAGVEEYAEGVSRNESGKGPAYEVSRKADDELPDGFTAAEAVRRLEAFSEQGRPFFLAVGFLKPHLPFVAPKKYWDLHDPAAIPVPPMDRLPDAAPAFAGHDNGELHQYDGIPAGNPIPADVARTLRHGYYACVSYADAQIGRLLDALDRSGLSNSTIVVLWGDHGWQLGEHGLWQKHTNFERATRAPLIIAAPRVGSAGSTCSAPVEFVDVYPTLADACGLQPPAGLAGKSLVPLLHDPTAKVEQVAISQYPRKAGDGAESPVMGYSVRDERWRLTVWREDGGTRVVATELYDERDDPDESRNLAAVPEFAAVVARLAAHLPRPGPRFGKASGKAGAQAAGKASGKAGGKIDVARLDRERILRAADAALGLPPITITAHRPPLSEGGPNDFYSNGDYWWPDPTKPDGLPYIRRDGQTNPGNFVAHRDDVRALRDRVAALAAAHRVSGDPRYAAKADELLRVFLLDPATRMNPHLAHAQAVPGVSPGRPAGIIDGLHLIEVATAVKSLAAAQAIPAGTIEGVTRWFADLCVWMKTSENGREEAAAKNNHAVAYFVQLAAFADLTGDESLLDECRRQYRDVFVPNQMAADGSFPQELKRTKPYGYSIFQLDQMATLCQILSRPDDDLWSFSLPDGRGIRRAVAYLRPFVENKGSWPLPPDVEHWDGWPARQPFLLFAGLALGEPESLELWQRLPADPEDPEVRRNIPITQPVLWLR